MYKGSTMGSVPDGQRPGGDANPTADNCVRSSRILKADNVGIMESAGDHGGSPGSAGYMRGQENGPD